MFAWKVDTIWEQLEHYLPHNADRLNRIGSVWTGPDRDRVLADEFVDLEKISIDYAVMERAKNVYMCELDCHWVDVGSYHALADSIGTIDQDDNVSPAHTSCKWLDCSNNIAITNSPDHLIAAIGVEGLVIVQTDDATLICPREDTDRLKELLERIQTDGYERFL